MCNAVAVLVIAVLCDGVMSGGFEKNLYRTLLADYEALARPVTNESEPVVVTLGITLQQIIDIDEKNQVMQTNIWLTFKWTDERMKWEPEEFGGIDEIRLPPTKLWKPDILLYNSVDESFDSTFPTNLIVKSDGKVEWLPPGIVKSTCKIDITWFPFDSQKCELKYGSWTYSGKFLVLKDGDVVSDTYTENGEWSLLNVSAHLHKFQYECCPDAPYYDITFMIHVQRRTLYYGFNFIIPCVLISLMTLLDFILPPESGEKLTLGITIFMSLCVFLLMVAEAMPPTSDAVPLIGTYFSSIMIVVSASQVLTVLVLNLHYRTPKTHVMSPMMRKVFLVWLPWLLMMKRPGYRYTRNGVERQDEDEGLEMKNSASKSLLANVLNIDDSVPSWHKETPTDRPNGFVPTGHNSSKQQKFPLRSSINHLYNNNDVIPATMPFSILLAGQQAMQESLVEILKELRLITCQMLTEENEAEHINDWKFSAMVLDRLSLIMFTTILVVSTCAIIFAAPNLSIEAA